MLDKNFTVEYGKTERSDSYGTDDGKYPYGCRIKKEVEKVCSEMGLSMTTAFTLFAKKLNKDRRIPFEITGEMSKENAFQIFMSGVNGFTDDYFKDGREAEIPTERDNL